MKPRIAVRGILLHNDRLLLVNAYGNRTDLWCAPGGGVETGASLPDNLIREIFEETGLTVAVGPPALVNEFHEPASKYHQIDIFFRCSVSNGEIDPHWTDPEGVVSQRNWVTREEYRNLTVKPDSLGDVAWGNTKLTYDPLEILLR